VSERVSERVARTWGAYTFVHMMSRGDVFNKSESGCACVRAFALVCVLCCVVCVCVCVCVCVFGEEG
jgi:hypothetical protein